MVFWLIQKFCGIIDFVLVTEFFWVVKYKIMYPLLHMVVNLSLFFDL